MPVAARLKRRLGQRTASGAERARGANSARPLALTQPPAVSGFHCGMSARTCPRAAIERRWKHGNSKIFSFGDFIDLTAAYFVAGEE